MVNGIVARAENSATERTADASLRVARQVSSRGSRSRPESNRESRAMSRIPGLLGERIIRRLIRQLSMTLSERSPLEKRQKVLAQIMSLREELQPGSLIHEAI